VFELIIGFITASFFAAPVITFMVTGR